MKLQIINNLQFTEKQQTSNLKPQTSNLQTLFFLTESKLYHPETPQTSNFKPQSFKSSNFKLQTFKQ
jgi:hypothetical protein